MQKRKLGTSGLTIAPLVLGGNVFGWTADKDASFAVLDAFVGAGLVFDGRADPRVRRPSVLGLHRRAHRERRQIGDP